MRNGHGHRQNTEAVGIGWDTNKYEGRTRRQEVGRETDLNKELRGEYRDTGTEWDIDKDKYMTLRQI